MLIGDVFRNREAEHYPSVHQILSREVSEARQSYPQYAEKHDDMTLLALRASALSALVRSLQEANDKAISGGRNGQSLPRP
jgi:hypothetical protein